MKNFYTLIFFVCVMWGNVTAQQKKNTAAVLNFVNSGGVDKNEISILTNRFSNFLVNAGFYKVLEREKMDAILKEQDFSMTDNCNAAECAIQIGQLLGMDRIITGNIGKFGELWTLDVRVIDVSTGEILKTQSATHEGRKEGLLGIIEGLAYTISGLAAPGTTAMKMTTDKSSAGMVTEDGSFTDSRDGQTYKTLKIGNQTWMAENLNYDAGSGTYCYQDLISNCIHYGKLYTWEAAKRAVPTGWHLPTKREYELLLSYLGGKGEASFRELTRGEGSFNILFSGLRGNDGSSSYLGSWANLWSSSGSKSGGAWYLYVGRDDQRVDLDSEGSKYRAVSVRCLKD